MLLDMPESVLVRLSGERQPGSTLRNLDHTIPRLAMKEGLFTVPMKNKVTGFARKIMDIDELSTLKCEQAFGLFDASAERTAADSTIELDKGTVLFYWRPSTSIFQRSHGTHLVLPQRP